MVEERCKDHFAVQRVVLRTPVVHLYDVATWLYRYEWWKNGAPITSQFNVVRPARGQIRIKPLTSLDEGHYECRAFNQYGTAVSRSTVLQRADIGQYPSSDPLEETGLVEVPYVQYSQIIRA